MSSSWIDGVVPLQLHLKWVISISHMDLITGKPAFSFLLTAFYRGANHWFFFRTPSLKSRKNHMQKSQNHRKITYKSIKNHKSSKNYWKITRKTHWKSQKSQKNHRKKSCDSKITKITYAILRSDLPIAFYLLDAVKLMCGTAYIGATTITESVEEKLLGVTQQGQIL